MLPAGTCLRAIISAWLTAGFIASCAVPANAAVVSWTSPVSGSWSDGTRWSGGDPPGPTDDARIIVSGPGYRVTLDVNASVRSITLGNGATPCSLFAEGRSLALADTSIVYPQGFLTLRNSVTTRGLLSAGAAVRFTNLGTVFLRHSTVNLGAGTVIRNGGDFICARTCSLKGPGDFSNLVAGSLVVTGLSSAGTLVSVNDLSNAGTIELTDTDTMGNFVATLVIPGGTLANLDGGAIHALAGIGSGAGRAIKARLVNDGLLECDIAGHILDLDRASADHVNNGRVDVIAGTLRVTQSGTTPTFTNSGRVEIDGGATLRVMGTGPDYLQSEGRTILNAGSTLDADRDVRICGGTLEGSGTVSGDTFICGGRLTPGHSPECIVFTDGYTQEPDGSMLIELGPFLASIYDTVTIMGHADLAGSLLVRFLPGITPSAGDAYPVLEFGSRSGTFDVFRFEGRGTGGLMDTVFTPTRMSIELLSDFTSVAPDGSVSGAIIDAFTATADRDGTGSFQLSLTADTRVVITVFDVAGRRVSTLENRNLRAGRYDYPFGRSGSPGAGLPSGVYFARAEAVMDGARAVRGARLVLVR